MDPLIEKAKADLAQVVSQMEALRAKKQKLEAFLSIYDEPQTAAPLLTRPDPHQEALLVPGPPLAQFESEGTTAKARITNAVAQILADGKPRHTRELLVFLAQHGLEPGATDKVIGLSNLLSRDARFEPDRTVGWSLKK